jgi:hypothetical protein
MRTILRQTFQSDLMEKSGPLAKSNKEIFSLHTNTQTHTPVYVCIYIILLSLYQSVRNGTPILWPKLLFPLS